MTALPPKPVALELPPRTGRDLATLPSDTLLHAEDVNVGDWMDLGSVAISREEIIDFALRFDPLPIHLDGSNSPFGDVIASSVHTMCCYSSLASRRFVPRLALVAGKGIDRLRLPHPVRPGAVLTGSADIVAVEFGPRRANLHTRSTLADQDGQVVLSFVGITVVKRRDPVFD